MEGKQTIGGLDDFLAQQLSDILFPCRNYLKVLKTRKPVYHEGCKSMAVVSDFGFY